VCQAAGADVGEVGGGGEDSREGVSVGDGGAGHHAVKEAHDVRRGGAGLLLGECIDETVP